MAPERFGAHPARLTDRAQIELILDAVRTVSASAAAQKVLARAAGVMSGPSGDAPQKSSPGWTGGGYELELGSRSARLTLRGGESMLLEKRGERWTVAESSLPPPVPSRADVRAGEGVSVGRTFIPTEVSREHSITRLTQTVTQERLDRALFGRPERSASYYSVHYTEEAPFVEATYVQFVTDPGWNRLLYGNINRWIKAFDDLHTPSGIAADASGRVFVGEEGRNRVRVLRLEGSGDGVRLVPAFTIDGIASPADLTLGDGGTPLDVSDDVLYVADPSANVVLRYSLGQESASLTSRWEGFDGPTRLTVGRWNGTSNGLLYVVDALAKRVRVFSDDGGRLSGLAEMRADPRRYYSSVGTDHFGQVYLVDEVGASVAKFTPALEFLDEDGGDGSYTALASITIPFGRIEVDGDGVYWAGFDQLFGIERWGEGSGAQRRTLGLKMSGISFSSGSDASRVVPSFTLTDPAHVKVRVTDGQGRGVRTVDGGWMLSGRKELLWDRRGDRGEQVAGGTYLLDISATAAYSDVPLVSTTRLQLPFYYDIRCGSPIPGDDPFRVQGERVLWGTAADHHAVSHDQAVLYRITGLDPSSAYAIEAWFESGDGSPRVQDLRADDVVLAGPVQVASGPLRTGVLSLPGETTSDGEVLLSINRLGEGPAVISRLILKESGGSFVATPSEQVVPVSYALEQNYPNPFNPSTVIQYALPEPGHVLLTVYDVAGREVATLVEEDQAAGVHRVSFDAGRFASGVYLYRLRAGSFTQVRKMVLVK
jgi:hypothetical protein